MTDKLSPSCETRDKEELDRARSVTIYGAGIAGLTVAHELAERGFKVRVVECDTAYDKRGALGMAIGGAARTQYAAARRDDTGESRPLWCQSELSAADARLHPARNQIVQLKVRFRHRSDWIHKDDRSKLERQLYWCFSNFPEAQKVEIQGYVDPDQLIGDDLHRKRAAAVKQAFEEVWRLHPTMARINSPPLTLSPIGGQAQPANPWKLLKAGSAISVNLLADGDGIDNKDDVVAWLKDSLERRGAELALWFVVTAGRSGPGYPHVRELAERHLRIARARVWSLVKSHVDLPADLTFRAAGEVKLVDGIDPIRVTLYVSERPSRTQGQSGKNLDSSRRDLVGASMRIWFGPLCEYVQEKPKSGSGESKQSNLMVQQLADPIIRAEKPSFDLYRVMPSSKELPSSESPPAQGDVSPSPAAPRSPEAGEEIGGLRATPWRPVTVQFGEGAREPEETEKTALRNALTRLFENTGDKEIHRITVTGYVGAEVDPKEPRLRREGTEDGSSPQALYSKGLAEARAKAISGLITDSLPKERSRQFRVEARWARPGELAASVLGEPMEHNRVAVVDVRRVMLPGEHGFRFFPSYYNHVFDTMRRIPILDESGRETGRSVYDNVMPTPNQGVAQNGLSPLILPRSPPESAYERKERLSVLRDLGYTPLDVLQFMLRTLRYMSTCSKRRSAELEAISWWEYLQGYDPRTDTYRYKYSERFKRDITTQARTLASFDAVWGDARTCGNTWVQLFYNWLQPAAKVDGTLNGPTSEAWLDPWRQYLTTRLGVEFVQGTLVHVELEEKDGKPTVVPHVWLPDEAADTQGPGPVPESYESDYYVIATDPRTAEEVTRNLYGAPGDRGRIGVPLGLDGFTTRVRPEPPEEGPGKARSPSGKFGLQLWDRFQTMSGIQFFFKNEDFKLNDGYVFFNKAAWALTSINSAQFWTRRPTEKRDGFTSLITVDLCDWDAKADGGRVVGKSMWECTANEIADEVWRQITKEIRLATPRGQTGSPFAGIPPRPTWFHIDRNIEFGKDPPDVERPVRNRTPYLVPIKADWRNRPGAQPWDPSPVAFNLPPDYPEEKRLEGEWQARHGGYLVHWDKLVFAGVYLKTFTRMTTMEAANESGRHAANAILDHWLATSPGRWSPRHREAVRARADEDEEERIEEARHMRSSVFYTATPGGDYCKIWNPERWEMPDFMLAKQADERNFDLGLPHPWDVFGLETIPSLLSHTINAKISGAAPNKLGASLPDSFEAAFETLLRSIYPEGGWDSMLDVLRKYRREIDEQMRNAARAARGEPLP
ncbi:FAD-binding protein [Sorangium sp. So ce693]|uniref:FAD-binding protein n=1 Tax=Sorangium sp. So ce693 TaxID=3133318 RepID=UPI003F636DAB